MNVFVLQSRFAKVLSPPVMLDLHPPDFVICEKLCFDVPLKKQTNSTSNDVQIKNPAHQHNFATN